MTTKMKAISLKQPYASWVANGPKTIETRTWCTKYRGPLLICSSKTFHDAFFDLEKPNPNDYPLGVALAIADLIGCRVMTKADERAACCEIYERAKAWLFANVKRITPFPVKGQLGIFEVDVE